LLQRLNRRRGRPRKVGARYPCGKLKGLKQAPTPELILRRVEGLRAGGVDIEKPPPTLSGTGLRGPEQPEYFRLGESVGGVLYAAGKINAEQFRDSIARAEEFMEDHPHLFPKSCLDLDGMPVFRPRLPKCYNETE
jgi:hypothetical protein